MNGVWFRTDFRPSHEWLGQSCLLFRKEKEWHETSGCETRPISKHHNVKVFLLFIIILIRFLKMRWKSDVTQIILKTSETVLRGPTWSNLWTPQLSSDDRFPLVETVNVSGPRLPPPCAGQRLEFSQETSLSNSTTAWLFRSSPETDICIWAQIKQTTADGLWDWISDSVFCLFCSPQTVYLHENKAGSTVIGQYWLDCKQRAEQNLSPRLTPTLFIEIKHKEWKQRKSILQL